MGKFGKGQQGSSSSGLGWVIRVAAIAFLIAGVTAIPAAGQATAAVQVSAQVMPLDTIQVAAARHLAAGDERWQPVRGSTVADVRFEYVSDLPADTSPTRRSRRAVVSYVSN